MLIQLFSNIWHTFILVYLVVYLVLPHWQIIQPVWPTRKPIGLFLIYANLDLNALMLDASTVRRSSKFHLLITLFEKKYLVISLVHWVLTGLHE